MEAIRYLFEFIASFVFWIGIPALITWLGGLVLRRLDIEPTTQTA